MKTTTRFNRSRMAQRAAFTLIELMVVITIIAALAALTASAVLKFMEVQQTSNTQSTLDRVQSQLGRAWSKVKDDANRSPMTELVYPGALPPPLPGQNVGQWIQLNLAGSDANATGRTRAIYVKLRLRQAFPMNFAEALNVPYQNPELANWGLLTLVNPSPLPPLPAYVTYLTNLGFNGLFVSPQPYPQAYESSACLLMALQRGVSGAGIDPSELTTGGATGSFVTPSGGNLPYLTDAWGRPIFFSRFPTGSTYLNPAGALVGNNDPGDPQGYLNSPYWQTLPAQQNLFSQLALQQLAPKMSPPLSFKLAPMVASGGPVNWTKPGIPLTFDAITFSIAKGYFIYPTGPASLTIGSGAVFSIP